MKKAVLSLVLVSGICTETVLATDGDLPVVLTPSRLAQPQNLAPSAVSVIDKTTIRAMGVRKITDIFRLVPGMQVGSPYGNLQAISYHGLSDEYGRRIQVLVDGRSTWQTATGGVFWGALPVPLDDIERIEVIRGPNTATYGSSAFLATINVITTHTSESAGVSAKIDSGNGGLRDGYVRVGNAHDDLSYAISVKRSQDDGYEVLNDSRVDDAVLARLDYFASSRDSIMIQAGASNGVYDAGEGAFESPLRDITQEDSFQHLQWTRALGGGSEFKFILSNHHFVNKQFYAVGPITSPIPVGTLLFDYGYENDRQDVEFSHTVQTSDNFRFVWGASGRHDDVYSQSYFDTMDAQQNDTYRMFAHMEYRLTDKAIVNAGVMGEKSSYVDTDYSPRVALIYQPTDTQTIRAAVNTGTRQATMWEEQSTQYIENDTATIRFYKTYASGGLDLEKIVSRELGWRFDKPGYSVDVKAYSDTLTNLIVQTDAPAPTGTLGYYGNYDTVIDIVNDDAVDVIGVEVEAIYKLDRQSSLRVAYANTQIDGNGHSDLYNNYELSAPRNQLSALYTQGFGNGWSGSLFIAYQDEMIWLGGDKTDAYTKVDLRIGKQFNVGGKSVDVELIGQNLAGDYADFSQEVTWEPIAFVRGRLEL